MFLLATFTFLLLTSTIKARITVEITPSPLEEERFVDISGFSAATVSDEELDTFELTRGVLDSVTSNRIGDAKLQSPPHTNDEYSWAEVKRVLKPIRATITSVVFGRNYPAAQIMDNRYTKSYGPRTHHVWFNHIVNNTIAITWEKTGELTNVEDIEHICYMRFLNTSGNPVLIYKSKWGEDFSKLDGLKVITDPGVPVELNPQDCVFVQENINEDFMTVKVEYEACLAGVLGVKYPDSNKYWGINVESVLKLAGLQNKLTCTELIEYNYYSYPKVVIKGCDRKTVFNKVPISLQVGSD